MRHNESVIQQNCVKWFRLQYPQLARLLIAIPNGGARRKIEGAILKAEGVMPGAADLQLIFPNGNYHGLFIEMKTKDGVQRESQKAFQHDVEWAGFKYAICRSLDDFMSLISSYLN